MPEPAAQETGGRLTETERRSIAAVMAMGSIPLARPGSAIKAINPGGSRPPLFWCFNSPARDMVGMAPRLDPEQPLYGLYSGGKLFARTDAFVARIARYHAEEIIALRPDGPYVIGGDCHGGRVAVEIARVLAASGRSVEKLCLLEYSNPGLHDFDGQLLLLFGKQSRLRAYRAIRWGAPGWREPFRRPPVVEGVSGSHGRYFRPYYVDSLMRQLDRFLQNRPHHTSSLAGIESNFIMAIQRIPMLFQAIQKLSGWRNAFFPARKSS